jgi:uncharacterized delta-60 repeat protein
VAKFDREGTLLWQHTLNGTAFNSTDPAFSVAVDRQGNVVAAGITENTGTFRDFTVAKFDRDGALLWHQALNGTAASTDDQALSVALDNQGNVVAAGFTLNTGTYYDFTVAKFDRDGALLWQRDLHGAFNGIDPSDDRALSVAVDKQGDVVAAGYTQIFQMRPRRDFTVAKFDGDGTLLWQQTLNNSSGDAHAVAVDQQGNVIAAGRISNRTFIDFMVAKFAR